jgi:transglutaminase-like putative cysteine protease
MSTTGSDFHVVGAVQGSKIVMTEESGGQRQSHALDIQGPVYALVALPSLIRSKNLQPNAKYEITVFDPEAGVNKTDDAEVTVVGDEKINLRDTLHDALKVAVVHFGVPETAWIDSSGVVLREDAPPSSVMLLEPSATALAVQAEETPPDLMNMFAVPAEPKLDNPRQLKYLKLELSGVDPRSFDLADESQQVLNVSPLTLVITPAQLPAQGVSFPIKGETTATKPSLTIQSDNQLIVRQSRKIAGASGDATAAARAIENWVFTNVRSKGSPTMPSATDVLQTMEGDCNEHAVLYAALCRAVGIPCKICVGLVYRDGYFWYHAWNKVFIGAWVPVDATFGQFPIDATHIKLTEGELDEQAKVLTVVGNIAIRILESKT